MEYIFQVSDFGYNGAVLGYYAGGLAASFCAAQFTSSILWGIISDRYGRKMAVIVGKSNIDNLYQ